MANLAFTAYPFPSRDGTLGRTLPDRLHDVMDVRDFGAVGDGVTPDTNAIVSAINWNSVNVTATATALSGAMRIATASWVSSGGGTVTMTTTVAHGLTTGDQVKIFGCFSSGGVNTDDGPGAGVYNGLFTVTVVNPTTFTYVLGSTDPLALGYRGTVLPQITNVTWSGGTVTVDYGAPHRLTVGTNVTVLNLGGISGGPYTIATTPTTRQLTFPVAGSGTITPGNTSRIQPPPILTVADTSQVVLFNYMAESYPTCDAATYLHQATAKTSNTITFSAAPFWGDVPNGATVRIQTPARGTVFFPRGTYFLDQSILLADSLMTITLMGTGNSVIQGNVNDYMINKAVKTSYAGPNIIEKLKFVNSHPTGKAMRWVTAGTEIRDCVFEANWGLNLTSVDVVNVISFSTVLSNCKFGCGSNVSGSRGVLLSVNNATVSGCTFDGIAQGMTCSSFGQMVQGNRFSNCAEGLSIGVDPIGNRSWRVSTYRGNYFNNCGIAIRQYTSGSGRIEANYIVGGGSSTHGFRTIPPLVRSFMRANDITGTFSTQGVSFQSGDAFKSSLRVRSMRSPSWGLPSTPASFFMEECDVAPVFAYVGLLGEGIASASWSAGTVTLTTVAAHGFTPGVNQQLQIDGVTVGGSAANNYNGIFATATASGTSITYALPNDPGTADANTGSVRFCSPATLRNQLRFKTLSWSSAGGGTVSGETWGPHYMGPGSSMTVSKVLVGGSIANGYNGTFTPSQITVVDGTHLNYSVASNPGTVDSACLVASATTPFNSTLNHAQVTGTLTGVQPIMSASQGDPFYNITDGTKFGGGTANIGDRVVGGGSQHIKVKWTQNGWVRYG